MCNNKVIDYLCKVFPMIKENEIKKYICETKYILTAYLCAAIKYIPDIHTNQTDTHGIV